MKIVQLSSHFFPNVGGVETHLSDLVSELSKRHQVFVLTYRPLTTKTKWLLWEKISNLTILRFPWFPGFFNKLSVFPALEFLYLLPGLFISLPIVLMFFRPQIIHSHGLVAGFVGAFWGKLFGVRTVVSTHSIYHFPKSGFYTQFAKLIFLANNQVLCLSNQSVQEIKSLGIKNVSKFTYWINMDKFLPKKVTLSKFNVLFVGRLVKEKGVFELDQAAKELKKSGVLVRVAGFGPEADKLKNCGLLGVVSQDELPKLYSSASVLIVPSIHEEGFGRVVIEALACGIPVIASNRGALPEALNDSVGRLIDVTSENIVKTVLDLKNNKTLYNKLKSNTRKFAQKRYSLKNIEQIILTYQIV